MSTIISSRGLAPERGSETDRSKKPGFIKAEKSMEFKVGDVLERKVYPLSGPRAFYATFHIQPITGKKCWLVNKADFADAEFKCPDTCNTVCGFSQLVTRFLKAVLKEKAEVYAATHDCHTMLIRLEDGEEQRRKELAKEAISAAIADLEHQLAIKRAELMALST
jgi:hypothetical protein